MRRASMTPQSSLGTQNEPMIVVEGDEEANRSQRSTPRHSEDLDSPFNNPYLLSPWRDPREVRKHSLPTPQCTSGITASQVRRLSERGGEGSGPSPREQAFLATLSSAPAPTGRRHSVVTISRVPSTLFGRNRRESVAAFPTLPKASSRSILANRRESTSSIISQGPPPLSESRGSIHNLQLDIMDDIVSARKVRMKMWNTSNERVCEVQPLDEGPGPSTSPMRYTQPTGTSSKETRRFSDFVGTTLAPIPSIKRRASEFPTPSTSASTSKSKKTSGIVCTNTDLISILSSLTSSATEINQCGLSKNEKAGSSGQTSEQKRNRLKTSRSNSFDASILHAVNQEESDKSTKDSATDRPSNWFIKRHQPMAKKEQKEKRGPTVTFNLDKLKSITSEAEKSLKKIVWDEKSGSMVDAEAIGSAIEGFLRRGVGLESPSSPSSSFSLKSAISTKSSSSTSKSKSGSTQKSTSPSSWFSSGNKTSEEDSTETCDTSLCSTLKDLFVK